MNYPDTFKNPVLIENLFRDGCIGLPEVYFTAPEHMRTRALTLQEMMKRVEFLTVERISAPHVENDPDWKEVYADYERVLSEIDAPEAIEYAKSVEKLHRVKAIPSEPTNPCTEAQFGYLQKLGYSGPRPSKSEASYLIARLKK